MKKVQLLFLVAAAVLASACTKEETGQLAYSINLDRVGGLQTVTVTVGDTGLAVTAEVTQVTELSGVLEAVPAGSHLVSAAAYAAGASQAAAEVSATVTIVDGEVAALALVLGSSDIASIIASNTTPHVGEVISLTAELSDGSTPELIWSDDCGGNFHNNVSAEVQWNVDAPGTCNVSVQVASSAVSAATVALQVGLAKGTRILVAGSGECIGHGNEFYDDGATRVTYEVWNANGYYIDETGVNATSVGFDRVFGIDLDSQGRAVFSDRNGGRIFRVEKDGTLKRLAGGIKPDDTSGIAWGTATMDTSVYYPFDVMVDKDDNVIFGEAWGYKVKKIYAEDNTIYTVAGNGNGSANFSNAPTTTSFSYALGVAQDEDGNIYSAHGRYYTTSYDKIVKIYATGATMDVINFRDLRPWDVEYHDGYLYITERMVSRVSKMNVEGGDIQTLAGEWNRPGFDGDGALGQRTLVNSPRGLFVDADGVVYFSDMGNNRVRIIKKDGTVDTVLDDILAADVVLDGSRNMYVAGFDTCSIHKVIGPF